MRITRVICDICKSEEVDEQQPGEIRLKGHCDAGDPDRTETFESVEVCSRCMRMLFECIGRLTPAVEPGSSRLLRRTKH